MSEQVTSQIDIQHHAQTGNDIWEEFRQIERITLSLTQNYKYSLGKYSRFFIELENKRFMATQCPECDRVYAPARPMCPTCLAVTSWVELSGDGTVKTFSILHFSPNSNDDVQHLETPYILAYVLLDGASTLFPHLLKCNLSDAKAGLRVTTQYKTSPVQHPIHLMHFIPLEQS